MTGNAASDSLSVNVHVICMETPDGERFAVVGPKYPRIGPMPPMRVSLPEADARMHLQALGLQAAVADTLLAHAREHKTAIVWERTTAIGHLNEHGQRVVRKTDEPGRVPGQRLYVLGCTACGHEYTVDGADIHRQACPACRNQVAGGSR